MIKEVIFFSPGDPNDASLWSSVPYLYLNELKRRGILVHVVNFYPYRFIARLYNYASYRWHRAMKSKMIRSFTQSRLGYYFATPLIRRAIKKYSTADCCIFIGCGYGNYWTKTPSVLFAESSFEKNIRERIGRELTYAEKAVAKQHRKAFKNATLVTMLFPRDMDYIKAITPNGNILYKGTNVINTFLEKAVDESVIAKKDASKHILFVGRDHYLEGANMVVKAFQLLHKKDSNLRLDIIGLSENQIATTSGGVTCYGYLDKSNDVDRELYYKLILQAKVFTNPTPFWGAYSSCIEAMYYYTPCVVHPYDQFASEFGKAINFGEYNTDFTPEGVAESLSKILYADNYQNLALVAHERVKDYSWESFISWTFHELENATKRMRRK